MSGTRRAAFSGYRFLPASFSHILPASWSRNKYRAGARKLEMKKVRLTATRVSVSHYKRFKLRPQSRLLLREVILWGLLTTPAYWKRKGGRMRLELAGDTPDISLFEKRMRYLFIRETARRATALYSRNVCSASLYIFEKRGEPKMKTVREESTDPTSKLANARTSVAFHVDLYIRKITKEGRQFSNARMFRVISPCYSRSCANIPI